MQAGLLRFAEYTYVMQLLQLVIGLEIFREISARSEVKKTVSGTDLCCKTTYIAHGQYSVNPHVMMSQLGDCYVVVRGVTVAFELTVL